MGTVSLGARVSIPQTLLERQRQMEDEGMADGVRRFRERVTRSAQHGRASDTGAARKLLQTAIDPLADALAQLVEQSRGRAGRKHQIERWIHTVGPEVLAYITVKTVLDGLAQRQPIRDAAAAIAGTVLDELRYRRFREEAPQLFDYRMERFNTSSYTHRQRSLNQAMTYAEISTDDLDLPYSVRLTLGVKLIGLLIETTQMVTIERATRMQNRKMVKDVWLAPTTETLEWMDARNGALEMLWPVSMPMVVPPLPWSPTQHGGYRYALRFAHRLVRTRSKVHQAKLKDADMPVVYTALNAIQATPWKVNRSVFDLVQQIVAVGGGFAGIPELEHEPEPNRPHDIGTNPAVRKAWRKKAHAVKERNHLRKLKALEFHKKFNIASALQHEDAIYFPCNLDFRGRVYPICSYLSPQGDDLSKGLLTFAEGKALGEHGAVWLALHGANCLGETPDGVKLSRCALQERVDWIVSHTAEIEAVAAEPLANRWWTEANVEDPLQFYAFCTEWAGYVRAGRSGAGSEYVCHLPCAMDGTCNGLQHFAAMFRDPIGGSAVNLLPLERPQDIYQRIADAVLSRLEGAASSSEYARLWLTAGVVNRKLAKRPTMTFGYGSKKYGFAQQLVEYIKGLPNWKDELAPLFVVTDIDTGKVKSCLSEASGYMAGLIWDALQVTVVAAAAGMAWMQDAARIVASNGKRVEWTVPATGFPVCQEYMHYTEHRVETILAGAIFRPSVRKDTEKPDGYKQANAVAPNFVHSLDAAALMCTVARCSEAGVSSFAMIHDSYATHAADAGTLASLTRAAFIDLYQQHNVIEAFATQLWQQAPNNFDEFPLPPEQGALDLEGIRSSLYFFS